MPRGFLVHRYGRLDSDDDVSDGSSDEPLELTHTSQQSNPDLDSVDLNGRDPRVGRLVFEADKTSPVSGTFIRDSDEDDDDVEEEEQDLCGDIPPSLNTVSVTDEARAELAKIENRLGAYVCQLCKRHYGDAFGLAQHRCSRIAHVEYRCSECGKLFNCPANLASHRRWHRPRHDPPGPYQCPVCHKRFRRRAYLRKHAPVHPELVSLFETPA
ncbi:transcription factor egl-46-like isoform X1 [Ornithodoros turicata]|uniref:transcription factor egl-46-like isoform X1 n=1 Tax=Ornithodoros turicata TaxID=34597 RepID=UPI0031397C23